MRFVLACCAVWALDRVFLAAVERDLPALDLLELGFERELDERALVERDLPELDFERVLVDFFLVIRHFPLDRDFR
jgi:hypothetical protein